jgi:hypothetical protein
MDDIPSRDAVLEQIALNIEATLIRTEARLAKIHTNVRDIRALLGTFACVFLFVFLVKVFMP